MKVLETIKKIVIGTLITVYFIFALAMTTLLLNYNDFGITEFGDTSLILVDSSISNDKYEKGDLVLVERQRVKNIQVGDEIFTYHINSQGQVYIEIGTVGTVYVDDNAIKFENGETYSDEFIIGKATNIYEDIGTFLSIVESKWGFLFIVLVPCFLIFIYELYSLIIEIKYGTEED